MEMPYAKITLGIEKRKAVADLNNYTANKLELKPGEHDVLVYGPYQAIYSSDESYPVFVCELPDGRVFEIAVEKVRFVDKEDDKC